MEHIVDKHMIRDLRDIVMEYVDEYRTKYEHCVWELNVRIWNYNNDKTDIVTKWINYAKAKFYKSHQWANPKWTCMRNDYNMDQIRWHKQIRRQRRYKKGFYWSTYVNAPGLKEHPNYFVKHNGRMKLISKE